MNQYAVKVVLPNYEGILYVKADNPQRANEILLEYVKAAYTEGSYLSLVSKTPHNF